MFKIGDKVRVRSHFVSSEKGEIINRIQNKDGTYVYHVELRDPPRIEYMASWHYEEDLQKSENGLQRARRALCDSDSK